MNDTALFNKIFGGICLVYVICNVVFYGIGVLLSNEVLLWVRYVFTIPAIMLVEIIPGEKVGAAIYVWNVIAALGNGAVLYIVAWLIRKIAK